MPCCRIASIGYQDHPSALGWRSVTAATTTTESSSEGWLVVTGGTLGLVTLLTAAVATIVSPRTTTASWSVITTHHAAGRSVAALLLDVRGGHNLGRQVKPFAEVVQTLGREGVVIVLPGESSLQVASRGERLASLDHLNQLLVDCRTLVLGPSYIKVLDLEVWVLGQVVVLLGHEYALLEEVLVDCFSVSLGDKPGRHKLATAHWQPDRSEHTLSPVSGALREMVYNGESGCR